MYRQRQSPQAVRIRREGFSRNADRALQGRQFVAHIAALPGNPYDGHTLGRVVPEITRQIGVSLQRIVADKGYRGHNASKGQGLSVFTSGQKRGVTEKIKRELQRRSAVEPVIGHIKSEHRMDRNVTAHPLAG